MPPPPELHDLARLLLDDVAGGLPAPASAAAAVELACQRLTVDLTGTLGSGGASSLLSRALYRATQEHPVLNGVSVDVGRPGCFVALGDTLARADENEANAAAVAILTQLFRLLVTFLGEELGLQPVFRSWPNMARGVRKIAG